MPIQNNIPNKLSLDKNPRFLDSTESFYLLNHERNREGYGGVSTPMTGNYPFGQIEQPAGENYSVDSYYHAPTNEVYGFVYNSLGVHYIQRLSDAHGLEIVYQNWGDNCLRLSAEPRHVIKPGRVTVRLETVYDKRDGIGCKNRHGKYLVWTDGLNDIGHLDVEASIITDSFRTPFFETCPDYCALIRLCVPDPCIILGAELVPRSNVNNGLSNKILDIGFKFIYRYVTYDERRSEWSTPSSLYYQSRDNCFDSVDSLPRCYKLRIPIGNPQVERIEVAFNKGDKSTEGNNDIYLSYEIIDKYKKYDSTQQYWYERQLSEVVTGNGYSDEDCSFDYFFCNDKNCNPVENPRTYNPTPITPQGLIVLKDRLGFYNYVQGNCPVDKFEIDKFNINVECVDNGKCDTDLVDVKVRLVIQDGFYMGYVYRKGGSFGDNQDDIKDAVYYGGNSSPVSSDGKAGNFGQTFNRARNFTAYIEGTSYFSEMKQRKAQNLFVSPQEYGVLSGFQNPDATMQNSNPATVTKARRLNTGAFLYQEAIFKVPKGKRGIIRIMSHESNGDDASTSTNIIGTLPINQLTTRSDGWSNIPNILTQNVHEIDFDTCGVIGNTLEINEAFVVGGTPFASVIGSFSGYVSDANNAPVEGLRLRVDGSETSRPITDHNGHFYFYYSTEAGSLPEINVDFYGEQDCSAFTILQTVGVQGILNDNLSVDLKLSNATYTNQFYESVRVLATDCNGIPVGGLRVALTGTKYKITDTVTGVATFKVRNYETRDRQVRGYIMDSRNCFAFDCANDCGACTPETPITALLPCFISTPSIDISLDKINIEKITVLKTGLKNGGRYPFGFVVKGNCGRISAVNELPYINIPKVQSSGISNFCSLSYNGVEINLPLWGTCLEIVRGENLNTYELQWVVDSFEKTSDGKIKITFQSLLDYNLVYSEKTNTKYQWLAGDRVEFINDQDGNPIDALKYGILNYLTVSPFNDTNINQNNADINLFNQVIIEDDGKLDFLKAGAIIEFQRQKECTTEPVFFSIGVSIPIVEGKLLYPIGTFKTFDTYQLRRTINNGALLTFEHHSPSDFWGSHLTDIGKVYFANKYENERRFSQSITLNSPNVYNYFGDIVKTFDGLSSDIISMNIKDGKIIMIICETDNALAIASDDLLRVGNDGVIRAASPDSIISDGEARISGEYGCSYDSIGSIFYGDDFAEWFDIRYNEKINNDYRTAKSVSFGKANTYFRWLGILISSTNKTATNPLDKMRFSTGQNTQTKAVQLTAKSLRHAGINNDDKPYISPNSTILFDKDSEDYLTFASWTPEGYSNMILNDGFGCAMITFQNGKPYIHPVVPANYNEFFGITCDRVVGISINGEGKMPQKNKVPISYEVQSDKMYFVSHVEISDPNFESEVPPIKVKGTERKWNASFLFNKNARNGLYNSGIAARDYYIKVTFKRDNTDQLKYGTIDNDKRTKFDVLGMVITNFTISEESGFTTMQ